MTEQGSPVLARRPELERAFKYLEDLAAGVDLSGISDPTQQWLTVLRVTTSRSRGVAQGNGLKEIEYTPVVANGVPAEWVSAKDAGNLRRIVYIHGGAWVGGSPLGYRAFSAALARRSEASVLVVDYRLAPEHRFPAGLDDCVKAFEWALVNGPTSEQAGCAGNDPAEWISLAGDSAGGNLAAAVCVKLAAADARLPDRLALLSGTLDHVSMSERVGLDDPICTPDALAFPLKFYLTPSQSAADPLVSPVFAPTKLLEKFPPTLIQVSTSEALLYDSKKFADRLEKARVRVNLSLWPELPHVWHRFLGLFPESDEAIAEIADFTAR